jgi:hypothetical protein
MRTLIGWISALFASAFIGAALYDAVLSDPVPQAAADTVVERMVPAPGPQPTLVRTEIREVVEPTPTITVEDLVLVAPAQPAAQPRTSSPAPARTAAPPPRGGEDRSEDAEDAYEDDVWDEDEDEDSEDEDHEDEDPEDEDPSDD